MRLDDIRTGKKFATEDVIVKVMTFSSIYRCCPVPRSMPTPDHELASARRCSITIRLSNNNQ
jgi:hypothetical protein